MFLREIEDYRFRAGNGHRALLENLTEKRCEIWVKSEVGDGLAWVQWGKTRWLKFDHVAMEAEIQEFHEF
jgi:hypothetical protein